MRMFEARYQGFTKTIMASTHLVARVFAGRYMLGVDPDQIAIVDLSQAAGQPQASPDDRRCQGCSPIQIEQPNPEGWQEVDGVALPSVSPWAQLDQSDLDKVHAVWTRRASDRADYFDNGAFCGF